MAKRNGFTTLSEAEMLEVVGGYFNPLDALFEPNPQPKPNQGRQNNNYRPPVPIPPHF